MGRTLWVCFELFIYVYFVIFLSGQVKLTHFGLSHNLKNSKQGNQVKQGKDALLWYQAPEILLGSEVCEPSVDIWSSGYALYKQ